MKIKKLARWSTPPSGLPIEQTILVPPASSAPISISHPPFCARMVSALCGQTIHVRVCVHDTLTARMCQMILSDIFSFRSEEDAPWPILPCFPATRGC